MKYRVKEGAENSVRRRLLEIRNSVALSQHYDKWGQGRGHGSKSLLWENGKVSVKK